MRILNLIALVVASQLAGAVPALADRGQLSSTHRPQAYGGQRDQQYSIQRHSESTRQDREHLRPLAGGPRTEERPDPNHQNPYRPMFSPNAVNPGEQHPYFQTPKAGFGYPTGNPGIYQGNGFYVIPR